MKRLGVVDQGRKLQGLGCRVLGVGFKVYLLAFSSWGKKERGVGTIRGDYARTAMTIHFPDMPTHLRS